MEEYLWIKDAINGSALVIVAFGAHQLLTKTFPSLVATFTSEIKAQRDLHALTLDKHNQQYTQTLENQRKDFLSELQAERASNIVASERMGTIYREQQKELIQMRCLRIDCAKREQDKP